MPRSVSIRRSLLINLLLVVMLSSGAIVTTILIGSKQILSNLSRTLIEQATDNIELQLNGYFEPVIQELRLALAWGQAGLLDLNEPDRLNRMFSPLIEMHPQISSLMIANDKGDEHMLLRSKEKWINRQTRPKKWNSQSLWLEWQNNDTKYATDWKDLRYDPRVRPWFMGATQKFESDALENIHWTSPYTFFTTKDPGITASAVFRDQNQLINVIGFDILLNDISTFTTNLQISKRGLVVVLTDKREIIGLPAHRQYKQAVNRKAALLKTPGELGIKVISDGALAFDSLKSGYTGPFRFISEEEPWWGGVKPFELNSGQQLWIAVVIPEEDLIGEVTVMQRIIFFITFCALVVATVTSILLARRYSLPIEGLVSQSDQFAKGNLDYTHPIKSSIKEVHRLADAQENMRLSLKSLLKIERDLQIAKQIQQSTFPDTLPLVDGFEIEAWIEPADETGGDTYDILETVFKRIDEHGGNSYDVLEADDSVRDDSSNKRIMFLLADATGHGIGPALLVTQLRSMLCMAIRMQKPLPVIAKNMNAQLCADMREGRFITAWLGELDAKQKTLKSFSAGQAPLLYYHAQQKIISVMNADTPPFGVVEDLNPSINNTLEMNKGDIFAVMSDGVFEALDENGKKFSVERVSEILRKLADEKLANIMLSIKQELADFTQNTPASDDKTLILIKCVN